MPEELTPSQPSPRHEHDGHEHDGHEHDGHEHDGHEPLLKRYDGIVCDLDGVVYRGTAPVPHAVAALTAAIDVGKRVVYATNNASRTPGDVATALRELGLALEDGDVVTSSQAGAARLSDLVPAGSPVLALGGLGVRQALLERGFQVVSATETAEGRHVDAVLQGYGADVGWRDLAEASYAVAGGAVWVATNDDMTLPTERGTAPGNGALVAAVAAATHETPDVVGKPHTPLYELSIGVLRTTPARTLAVGDRLDTDIAGADAAGIDSLLVLTGVSSINDVARAGSSRPTFVGLDLRCLERPQPSVERRAEPAAEQRPSEEPYRNGPRWVWTCGDARVTWRADGALDGLDGSDAGDGLDGVGGGDSRGEGTRGTVEERLRAGLAAVWFIADLADDSEPASVASSMVTPTRTADPQRSVSATAVPDRTTREGLVAGAVQALTRLVEAETR